MTLRDAVSVPRLPGFPLRDASPALLTQLQEIPDASPVLPVSLPGIPGASPAAASRTLTRLQDARALPSPDGRYSPASVYPAAAPDAHWRSQAGLHLSCLPFFWLVSLHSVYSAAGTRARYFSSSAPLSQALLPALLLPPWTSRTLSSPHRRPLLQARSCGSSLLYSSR